LAILFFIYHILNVILLIRANVAEAV
jgi:hypothetical protein